MKKIRSAADLAVNGARPAFAEPLHVGRPNIGSKSEFATLMAGVLDRKWLTNNGPLVRQLEEQIADYLGVAHCVAVCNGTVGLEIAIRALGLTGEVIVPSYTFIATAHALQWQEITPVFADIDPETHALDPGAVRAAISDETTGIIGVHLWGRAAPHEQLANIARERDLSLMYDAAHAFGCTHNGLMIGGLGRCEVLSFHATKFFNTFEGGAVVTDDGDLAERVRLMRNFGFAGVDNVIYPGTNGKMTEACAAMGLTNLKSLADFAAIEKAHYYRYWKGIAGINGLKLLPYDESELNNYHYVIVEVMPEYGIDRDELVRILRAENVLARRYFWPGCHRMSPYRELFPDAGDRLSNTNEVSARVVALPTGSALTEREIDGVIALIDKLPDVA